MDLLTTLLTAQVKDRFQNYANVRSSKEISKDLNRWLANALYNMEKHVNETHATSLRKIGFDMVLKSGTATRKHNLFYKISQPRIENPHSNRVNAKRASQASNLFLYDYL